MHKIFTISILLILLPGRLSMPADAEHNDQQAGRQDFYETINIYTDRDLYIAGERLYFRLDVSSPDNGPVSSIAYLILRNRENAIIESYSIRIEGNIGYGSIYLPDTLSSSSYQMVAFTNWMRNFGEESFAGKNIVVVNRFDEELTIAGNSTVHMPDSSKNTISVIRKTGPDRYNNSCAVSGTSDNQNSPVRIRVPQKLYGTREKISLELLPSLPHGSFASVAISVAQKQTLLNAQKGLQISAGPGYHPLPADHGSRNFFKETNGPVITGQVTDRGSRTGIADATVIMTTPDTVVNLLYAKTLSDGTFHIRLNDYHGGKELHFSLYDRDIAKNAVLRIDDKFRLEHPFEPGFDPGKKLSEDFIRTSQDIVRINKTLNIDLNRHIETERHGYRPELYSTPAHSFALFSEYDYLEDLQEIARELLPFLMVRQQAGHYTSNLMLQYTDTYIPQSPAYFLDGIYTDDINRIIHLDSDNLKSLELHNYKWRHGEILFPGIVAFFSSRQAYRNLELSEPTVSVENHPAADPSLYRPPDYKKDNIIRSRPDFRQLLFWNPEIKLENNGSSRNIEFYSGDLKGEFIIRVMGYTDDGEVISMQSSIIIDDRVSAKVTGNGVPDFIDDETVKTFGGKTEPEQPGLQGHAWHEAGEIAEDPDRYFEQGLTGMVNLPPRRPIGNQHYLTEEWLSGDVILDNGIAVRDKLLRYNGYLDELFWLYEGDYHQIQVDRNMVKEFRLHPPGHDNPVYFRRIEVHAPLLTGKDDIFGELLYEGDVSLYAYRRIIETGRGDYRVGDKLHGGIIIKPGHLYAFILPDGTTRVTRRIRRGNILDMFPENRDAIRSLLRENRMWPRNETDLIETARILNDYFTGK